MCIRDRISLFRLIIAPFLTWIVGVALHLSTPQLIAAVLVNATPVASTATILALIHISAS